MRLARPVLALFLLATPLAARPALKGQAPATAQPKGPVDIGKLLMDVARAKIEPKTGLTTVGFWLSPSVMEAVLRAGVQAKDPSAEGKVAEVMKALRPYQIFMVQREYENGLGERKALTADELRASSALEGDRGQRLTAVDSLPEEARGFIMAFRNGMEARSQNQHFELLIFPAQDAKGSLVERQGQPGRVRLVLGKAQTLDAMDMTWHYPLDALNPPLECAKCHESVSASWTYCAYCGAPIPR